MGEGGHESCIDQFILAFFVSSALIGRKYKKKTLFFMLVRSLSFFALLCIVI
jgi:hypothetical protein